MQELNEKEIANVSGAGAFQTLGNWVGQLTTELNEHPEAVMMGPVIGGIYLATRH